MNVEKKVIKRDRSKAYPGATLHECVEQVVKIKRNLGSGGHDRESLADGMGFSGVTGAVAPKIAALVYFGFLEKKGSIYCLSQSSRRVTDPLSDDEKKDEIKAAFKRPTLYADLLEKFEPDGGIPARLEVHLHRSHGIADKAAGRAADIFRKSAIYAEIMDDDGRFISESNLESDIVAEVTVKAKDNPELSAVAEKSTPMAMFNTTGYTVSISGPKLQFSVIVSDETDLMIIDAMLKKVRIFINEGGEAMHDKV